jgi:hypothetical protein
MSYLRYNEPLRFFTGISSAYIFVSSRENNDKELEEWVEDYDYKYTDSTIVADLLCRIVQRDSGDEKYAIKMSKVLAKHFGIIERLRPHPLTGKEWEREHQAIAAKIEKDPSYRRFIETLSIKKKIG